MKCAQANTCEFTVEGNRDESREAFQQVINLEYPSLYELKFHVLPGLHLLPHHLWHLYGQLEILCGRWRIIELTL